MNRRRTGIIGIVVGLLALVVYAWAGTTTAGANAPYGVPARSIVGALPGQVPSVTVTKSVGVTAGVCATTSRVEVAAGTPVYFCYTLVNNGPTPIEAGTLIDDDGAVVVAWSPTGTAQVNPGEKIQHIRAVPGPGENNAISTDRTSSATWYVNDTFSFISGLTTVDVFNPAVQTALTVSNIQATCGTDSTIALNSATPAYFCLTIRNTGDVTLTNHVITAPALGIENFVVDNLAIAPGVSAQLTSGTVPGFAYAVQQPQLSATVFSTSSAAGGASAPSAAAVGGFTSVATITFTKVIVADGSTCTVPSPAAVTTEVYYCLLVRNNGPVNLTIHVFDEPRNEINFTVFSDLAANSTLTLTNNILQNTFGQAAVLGPIPIGDAVTAMSAMSSSPATGFFATASNTGSISGVNFQTPTATPTELPSSTPTFPPTITPIPTMTWTPFPPTATPIPTWTPAPTPTPSPTVIVFSTPGGLQPTPYPQIGVAGLVTAQPGAFVSPLDPAAAAATATAAVLFGLVPPGFDPAAATATAAVQQGLVQPGFDPAAATATAAVLFGLVPPGFDPAAATATAAVQQGLVQPGFDPAAATATAAVLFGLVPPGFDPAVATATAAVQQGLVPPGLDPAAATATAAVQQGLVQPQVDPAAVTATALAAGMLSTPNPANATPAEPATTIITVTATPTVGTVEALAPIQRPVEPPTPIPPELVRSLFTQIFNSAGASLALIWFLVGSALFFVTAGVFAGLSFQSKEQRRFELGEAEDLAFQVELDHITEMDEDETWPGSLP